MNEEWDENKAPPHVSERPEPESYGVLPAATPRKPLGERHVYELNEGGMITPPDSGRRRDPTLLGLPAHWSPGRDTESATPTPLGAHASPPPFTIHEDEAGSGSYAASDSGQYPDFAAQLTSRLERVRSHDHDQGGIPPSLSINLPGADPSGSRSTLKAGDQVNICDARPAQPQFTKRKRALGDDGNQDRPGNKRQILSKYDVSHIPEGPVRDAAQKIMSRARKRDEISPLATKLKSALSRAYQKVTQEAAYLREAKTNWDKADAAHMESVGPKVRSHVAEDEVLNARGGTPLREIVVKPHDATSALSLPSTHDHLSAESDHSLPLNPHEDQSFAEALSLNAASTTPTSRAQSPLLFEGRDDRQNSRQGRA